MENLWNSRIPPVPLKWNDLIAVSSSDNANVQNGAASGQQAIWTIAQCVQVFGQSIDVIKEEFLKLATGDNLVWDKDDKYAMDFVASCANIRANIFGIVQKSRFEIKCMLFKYFF